MTYSAKRVPGRNLLPTMAPAACLSSQARTSRSVWCWSRRAVHGHARAAVPKRRPMAHNPTSPTKMPSVHARMPVVTPI